MKEAFQQDFSQFSAKLDEFIASSHFTAKKEEYEKMLKQVASIAPEEMKTSLQESKEFRQALEQSLTSIEALVSLYKGLDIIFKMDETALGKWCNYDLSLVDKRVSSDLKEAGSLLLQFDKASAKGRKAIELLEDPFASQGM